MIDVNQTYERFLSRNIAVKYVNRALIASQIFPWVPVPVDRIDYPKFDRGVTFKRPVTQYGARSAANELDLKVTLNPKNLRKRGLGTWIDDDERRLTTNLGDIRALKTQMLKDGLMIDLEVEVSTFLFGTGNYAAANKSTLAGVTQWSDYVNSDPKNAVLNAASGLIIDPNTMVVGKLVHNKLLQHPKLLDAIKYTTGAVTVTNEVLARYFGVERYFVGGAFVDSANEGAAESLGYIWGKSAWIGYVNYQNMNALTMQKSPTFGCIPISSEAGDPWRVYTEAPRPSKGSGPGMEYIKLDSNFDPLYPATDLGFLFDAAIA